MIVIILHVKKQWNGKYVAKFRFVCETSPDVKRVLVMSSQAAGSQRAAENRRPTSACSTVNSAHKFGTLQRGWDATAMWSSRTSWCTMFSSKFRFLSSESCHVMPKVSTWNFEDTALIISQTVLVLGNKRDMPCKARVHVHDRAILIALAIVGLTDLPVLVGQGGAIDPEPNFSPWWRSTSVDV